MKTDEIESPMSKLEHIYNCCTIEIQRTLDTFWRDYDVPAKTLQVDVDNLQSIIVYMISRMDGCPQILSSLSMIENFLPDAVQLSNRAFYLAMMQSSADYIIQQYDKMIEGSVYSANTAQSAGGTVYKDRSKENIERIKNK